MTPPASAKDAGAATGKLSHTKLQIFPFYIRLFPSEISFFVWKTCTQGGPPAIGNALVLFRAAQQLKWSRREWRGSLPHLATLSILTRVKLDSSSGCVQNGKVAHLAARVPGRPWGSVPKTPLGASAPASLPDRRRARIQRGIERGNNMHEN